jgi:predicted PurR-regulated permease PerM
MTSTRFFLDPRTARATWTILVVLGALGLAYTVRRVLLLAALSLFFAFLLFPAVRLVERWLGPRRLLAIVVVYLALLAALGGAGFAIGPRLATEAQSLAQKLPDMTTRIQSERSLEGSFSAMDGSRARFATSSGWCRRTWAKSSATLSRRPRHS